MSEIQKVAFVGLDSAGKTSILRTLDGTYSELNEIKPTLGTERSDFEIMGVQIKNWDLGGQERYRIEHLQNYKEVLFGTDLIIFVLDVQNENRFKEAVSYFDDILHALRRLKIKCPVLICHHKIDPDIAESTGITEKIETATNLFNDTAKKHNLKIKTFVTSIFNRKSLLEMFSFAISELIQLTILNRILDEFRQASDKLGVLGALLFDRNFFIVGNSFPNPAIKNTCFNILNSFTELLRDFKPVYDATRPIELTIPALEQSLYKFAFYRLLKITDPYYLLLMGAAPLKIADALKLFQEQHASKIETTLYSQIKTTEK